MDALLEFARGPLFRLTFAIMVLGLLRVLVLDLLRLVEGYRSAGDKNMPWKLIFRRSLEWFVPVKRLFHNRPFYSLFSILFHIGLILVPIFLFAHIQLWDRAIGLAWPALPRFWADLLTITTIVFGLALFFGRVFNRSSSYLSRKQDFLWPLILIVPFVTGFICSNTSVSPAGYQLSMLIHVLSAELIFVLIPFTKIAHCVIMPLSQVVANFAWRFPPDTDDKVAETLNKKGAPV